MSKTLLEQVIALAEQLSREDRFQLFAHLAALPDSDIRYLPPLPNQPVHPLVKQDPERFQQIQFVWHFEIRGNSAKFSLEGLEIAETVFNPENFATALFQKIKSDEAFISVPDELLPQICTGIREKLSAEGLNVTDEQIMETLPFLAVQVGHKHLKNGLLFSATKIRENLPDVFLNILAELTQTTLYTGVNRVRDVLKVPDKKYTEKEMRELLYGSHWDRIKTLLDISPHGGPRNIKHNWTDEEKDCLARRYEELRPIWNEAKRIALQAQRTKEKTRALGWRKEVLRAYPDLPTDLLERLDNPRRGDPNASPADIAIFQAKRECGVMEDYSTRQLSDIIRSRKFKASS